MDSNVYSRVIQYMSFSDSARKGKNDSGTKIVLHVRNIQYQKGETDDTEIHHFESIPARSQEPIKRIAHAKLQQKG